MSWPRSQPRPAPMRTIRDDGTQRPIAVGPPPQTREKERRLHRRRVAWHLPRGGADGRRGEKSCAGSRPLARPWRREMPWVNASASGPATADDRTGHAQAVPRKHRRHAVRARHDPTKVMIESIDTCERRGYYRPRLNDKDQDGRTHTCHDFAAPPHASAPFHSGWPSRAGRSRPRRNSLRHVHSQAASGPARWSSPT